MWIIFLNCLHPTKRKLSADTGNLLKRRWAREDGLVRSAGGWSALKALRRIGAYRKGDERILGDSDFVKKVLAQANEDFERKHQLQSEGMSFEHVVNRVAELLDVSPDQVLAGGKYRKTVAARSLLCFWATTELARST
jgi:chromosomal replication initiation ATPase DnaA